MDLVQFGDVATIYQSHTRKVRTPPVGLPLGPPPSANKRWGDESEEPIEAAPIFPPMQRFRLEPPYSEESRVGLPLALAGICVLPRVIRYFVYLNTCGRFRAILKTLGDTIGSKLD